MKTAYLDCFSGISGDMFLAALLDAGLALDDLKIALQSLSLEGYRIQAKPEERNYIYGTRLMVQIDKTLQKARGLADITAIIQTGRFSPWVKDKSIEIFKALAEVEAKIHGCPMDKVHFHEIGAVDSIVDIVGTVFGIEALGLGPLHCSALPMGSGLIKTEHGLLPNPAPAGLALLQGIPVYDAGVQQELVTPTGAALVRHLAQSFGVFPSMVVEKTGYGVGSLVLKDRPNLLRLVIGQSPLETATETVLALEANLDDCNPEWLGFLMDRLFQAQALDVAFIPLQMKKNRPGIQVQVLAEPSHKQRLMEIMFKETTTLGIRFSYVQRKVLAKTPLELESPWGELKANKILRPDGSAYIQPEYEACQCLAKEKGVALKEIYAWVLAIKP